MEYMAEFVRWKNRTEILQMHHGHILYMWLHYYFIVLVIYIYIITQSLWFYESPVTLSTDLSVRAYMIDVSREWADSWLYTLKNKGD